MTTNNCQSVSNGSSIFVPTDKDNILSPNDGAASVSPHIAVAADVYFCDDCDGMCGLSAYEFCGRCVKIGCVCCAKFTEYANYAKTAHAISSDYDPTVYWDVLGFVISQVANPRHRDCMYHRIYVTGNLKQPKYKIMTQKLGRIIVHKTYVNDKWLQTSHPVGSYCEIYGGCLHSAQSSIWDTHAWDARLYASDKHFTP